MEQATAMESSGNFYAALFHRAWLLKLDPSDTWRYDDLHETHRMLLVDASNAQRILPTIAVEMLDIPRGTELPQLNEEQALSINEAVWKLAVALPNGDALIPTDRHLSRMQAVCNKFPKGYYFNTLGVLQYRLGRFEDAVSSLNRSIELSPVETGKVEPSAWDLGFLAMCHFRL